MTEIEVKYQTCNLCDALHRNINDNFESVSFEILDDSDIQVKIVLDNKTEIEDEYIDDITAEFSAKQLKNCVRKFIVNVGKNNPPLKNIIYRRQ